MSDDLILPPEARLDPRRGLYGGRYVIVTCVVVTVLGLLWMMTMAVVA